MAYHDILDKGDGGNGALYARKDKWLAWCLVTVAGVGVQLRHANGWNRSGVRAVASARERAARQTWRPKRAVSRLLCCCAPDVCWPDQPPDGRMQRIAGGWSQSFSLQKRRGTEDSSVQRQRLTNVEQHYLGSVPARQI